MLATEGLCVAVGAGTVLAKAPSMRFWPALASLALVTAALSPAARADINGGKVKLEAWIPSDFNDAASTDVDDFIAPTPVEARQYFNRARCLCSKVHNQPQHVLLRISWEVQPMTPVTDPLFAWSGTGCPALTLEQRVQQCKPLTDIDGSQLVNVVNQFEEVGDLLAPIGVGCPLSNVTGVYTLSTSPDGGTTLMEQAIRQFALADQPADLQPPPVPTIIKIKSLENAIKLEWSGVNNTDVNVFQALCAQANGEPVFENPRPSGAFEFTTTLDACGVPIEVLPAATIANPNEFAGAPATPPATLTSDFDRSFVCGQVAGTATSIVIDKLENDTPYFVSLIAVDQAGNISGVQLQTTIVPTPVTDFWEFLNEEDPGGEGGFCLIEAAFGAGGGPGGAGAGGVYGALRAWRDDLRTTAAGRWLVDRYYDWGAPIAAAARESIVVRIVAAVVLLPLIALALAWHTLTLPGLLAVIAALVLWRRRARRGRAARAPRGGGGRRLGLAVAATLLLAPALASAQSVSPYWEEPETEVRVALPRFVLGFRVGPYFPSIDSRFPETKPYETTFDKGKSILPMADVFYVFTTRYGQFGGGLSGGYFTVDAPSFVATEPNVPGQLPPRTVDNRTRFNLVPLEATAIYRLTQLADNVGVPLVPYVRGGLGYYVWWTTQPDGDVSEVCPPAGGDCNKGRGASLGLVGAAGLAIRAEDIDADSARSMRNSGIEHAGFYAEVTVAWVDGFGNDRKLSVGDTTFFGGLNFEF